MEVWECLGSGFTELSFECFLSFLAFEKQLVICESCNALLKERLYFLYIEGSLTTWRTFEAACFEHLEGAFDGCVVIYEPAVISKVADAYLKVTKGFREL